MIKTIYIIILSYFVLGAAGFFLINRKKEKQPARENWTKYITYLFIIHVLFFSIVFKIFIFKVLVVLIIVVGGIEMTNLFRQSGFAKKCFYGMAIFFYVVLCGGFLYFSRLNSQLVLFAFLVLSIFDAFSQISGQLLGRRKILPKVSPGKTVEGLLGGTMIAFLGAGLLKGLLALSVPKTLLLAWGIMLFAFVGDLLASYYKRKYNVKDFSRLLPGHGGFLDRFDSLIAGGAFVALLHFIGILKTI